MIRTVLSQSMTVFCLLCLSNTSFAQMCSASEQRLTPDSRYEVLGSFNGHEVLDLQTNLVWQRCSIGQRWDGKRCKGKPVSMSWSEAKAAAKSLGSGYRLPTIEELQTLTDRTCYNAAMNERIFPNTQPDAYWSASPSLTKFGYAWYVDFYYGMTYQDDRGDRFYARPVRDAQP